MDVFDLILRLSWPPRVSSVRRRNLYVIEAMADRHRLTTTCANESPKNPRDDRAYITNNYRMRLNSRLNICRRERAILSVFHKGCPRNNLRISQPARKFARPDHTESRNRANPHRHEVSRRFDPRTTSSQRRVYLWLIHR